jgi:uncharacterized protein (TIGR02246 family)
MGFEEAAVGAKTPEEVGKLMEAVYRAKDADAIANLYEEDGIFANAPAWTAVGRAGIAEQLKELFAATTAVETSYDQPEKKIEVGDYAVVHGTSTTRISMADGSQSEVHTRTTTVAHRGTDGYWRFVLDHNSAP